MVRYPLIAALASLVVIVTLAVSPRRQLSMAPAVILRRWSAITLLPPPSLSLRPATHSTSYAAVQSYYRPFPILRPRLYVPGPTYYTPAYPYTAGYYSSYYAPGYFWLRARRNIRTAIRSRSPLILTDRGFSCMRILRLFPHEDLPAAREALRYWLWEEPENAKPLLEKLSPAAARATMEDLFADRIATLRPENAGSYRQAGS